MRSGQQLGLCFVQQDLLMQGRALQGGGRGAALLWCWTNSSGGKQRDKGDLGRGRHEIHLRGKWCPWSPDCGAANPRTLCSFSTSHGIISLSVKVPIVLQIWFIQYYTWCKWLLSAAPVHHGFICLAAVSESSQHLAIPIKPAITPLSSGIARINGAALEQGVELAPAPQSRWNSV